MSPARPSGADHPARPSGHLFPCPSGVGFDRRDAERHGQGGDGPLRRRHSRSSTSTPWSAPRKQMERVLDEVASAPGVVLHTLVDRELREQLEDGCRKLNMPQLGALDPLVGALSRYLGAALSTRVGAQHALDHEYFNRIAALDYAMAHDDGQGTHEQLETADVVLCGVSRTSKTPTCIYLAHRGIRAANVPLVPGQEDGERLTALKNAAGGGADCLARPAGADPQEPPRRPECDAGIQPTSTRTRCETRRSRRAGPSNAAAGPSSTSPAARWRRRRRRSSTC